MHVVTSEPSCQPQEVGNNCFPSSQEPAPLLSITARSHCSALSDSALYLFLQYLHFSAISVMFGEYFWFRLVMPDGPHSQQRPTDKDMHQVDTGVWGGGLTLVVVMGTDIVSSWLCGSCFCAIVTFAFLKDSDSATGYKGQPACISRSVFSVGPGGLGRRQGSGLPQMLSNFRVK